jgi:hypothetical protein
MYNLKGEKTIARWGNTLVPRVGRRTTIQGDIIGECVVNERPSLCVAVQNFAPAHGLAEATPRSMKRSRSAIADEENPATEPGFGDGALLLVLVQH